MGSSDQARYMAGDAAGTVQDKASSAVSTVQDKASQVGDKASSAAHDVADSVRSAPQAVSRQTQGNPLAVGLIAFGAGMLAATLIPVTDAERRAGQQIRENSGELTDRVKDVAQEMKEDVSGTVQEAVGQVKETAQDAAQTTKQQAQSSAQDAKEQTTQAAQSARGGSRLCRSGPGIGGLTGTFVSMGKCDAVRLQAVGRGIRPEGPHPAGGPGRAGRVRFRRDQ